MHVSDDPPRRLERELADERARHEKKLRQLECLHEIAMLFQEHEGDPRAILARVVELLARMMPVPEQAAACIEIGGQRWETPGFVSDGQALVALIRGDAPELGTVSVRERSSESRASAEERRLLETVASHVAAAFRRARAERELVAREAHFRALIESSTDVVSVLDASGRRVYSSPRMRALTGYGPEEVLGQDFFELVHPDDRETARATLESVVREGEARTEVRFAHRDGGYRIVEIVARNLLDDPNVQGIVSSLRDVTERRHLQQQLIQAQKMEAVGRLAGGVAHDFNNLLTVIEANAEMLLEDLAGASKRQVMEAEQILEAARRATSLTRQLLAFSRGRVVQPTIVDLRAVVGGMERMLRRLIGEDVRLSTRSSPHPLPVLADEGSLEQLLLNLAVNARDAMPRGGRLEIRAEDGAESEVRLVVTDDGEGMDAKLLDRVFDPFFTTKANGTGLGLSMVYGIVRQAGGEIDIESAPAWGTTVSITLPRADLPIADRAREHVELPDGSVALETVLVVEDERMVRRIACDVLARCGYRVLEAPDGATALSVARAYDEPIHLLLTDVVMPGMSGREVAEALELERPQLKVLYVSGHTDDATLRHGVRAHRVRLLQKPFTGTALAAAVRSALEG